MIPEIVDEFNKVLIEQLNEPPFKDQLNKALEQKRSLFETPRGNILKYATAIDTLPDIIPSSCDLASQTVTGGGCGDISQTQKSGLEAALYRMCPWRKGPFELFGTFIDTEWQSFIKWDRFIPHIAPLHRRRILDIGASNGYYMFRMAAFDPSLVVGLEPQHTFYFQYLALQKYLKLPRVANLPFTFDEFPVADHYFDTVFCMGVLYHRKSPLDMLKKIHDSLKKGGELVLENLIIDSTDDVCLFPENRYAKMRNVFFIPSIKAMTSWLKRTGFHNIRCVDVSATTPGEQRKTPWIQTESLDDFLDPADPGKTVEGYPAPVRAIFLANAH
ncbi:tRNA (mo5U34)-methyltransferase [Desulfocicer vacuolatum DSM 3385]|uniref:tRNA (Mo5U34)-methyltransferase n=1 Tax=Desulfocicer vacuolatum DSM 3385 TaxID=1121400 RepID=A0A1W2B832_9BACT|nr:tRNA 5-methoxyuridine(34)/uridine 5-oxyacetic acid(34) synthase CmoB [Desulfocicer vacuolatum]SMC69137.1 tRNA (mo5U34)-methyltransferase [Desulfocicer vacuolatum DSM 3385]